MTTQTKSFKRLTTSLVPVALSMAGIGLWACSAEFKTTCPEGTVQTAGGGDVNDACSRPEQPAAGMAGMAGTAGENNSNAGTAQGSGGGSGSAGQVNVPTFGGLDATFGKEGKVRVPILFDGQSVPVEIRGAKLQSTGKLIVGGVASVPDCIPPSLFWARLNEDGSLDDTFGGGAGYLILRCGQHALKYGVDAFEVLPDDKIVAVGAVDSPYEEQYATMLSRFNADGTPDDSFAATPTEPALGSYSIFRTIGDKLLVAGNYKLVGDIYLPPTSFYMFRFEASGNKDTSFAPVELKGSGGGLLDSGSVTVDSKGRFVAAMLQEGVPFMPNKFAAVARFTTTGLLDTSFGGQGTGYRFENFGTGRLGGIAVDGADRVVVGGTIHGDHTQGGGAVVRYVADGAQLDSTFGRAGLVSGAPQGNEVDSWFCLKAVKDDKVVAAGYRTESRGNADYYSASAVRLLRDGSLDAEFGGQGTGALAVGEGTIVKSCVLDNRGRVVVIGQSKLNDTYNIDGVRILNLAPPPKRSPFRQSASAAKAQTRRA